MTVQNVGTAEATLRVMLAALVVGVSIPLAILNPHPLMLVAAVVCTVGGALLVKSAVTRHCPIHDKTGMNTCSGACARTDGGNKQQAK